MRAVVLALTLSLGGSCYAGAATQRPWPVDRKVALDVRQVLPLIRVPTLVMVGDLDEGGTIEACRKLATDIPGARFELFEGVAHMVNLEQPERFTRLVLDFLTDAGVNAPATAAARG